MNTSQDLSSSTATATSTSIACRCRKRRSKRRRDENPDEVDKKIVALQKIIPGGERLAVDELFQETAEYIFALESQVEALRFLAAFLQTSHSTNRKLGA
ncbi:transcription factor PAR2-like [Salvia hispanica]|uniref:transcription factor PAR2-like n=1 Tax=Salvia hispanica TaxID=49212 RepID=UPI0020095EE6|nr:transcription factor PAR2-like [Salvia hispanica]